MDLNFDTIFKPTVIALKINRFHPSKINDKKWWLQCLVHMLGNLYIMLLLNSMRSDIRRNDFTATCRNGCLCGMHGLSLALYAAALIYQDKIVQIINRMQQDYERVRASPGDAEITGRYARRGSGTSKQWTVVVFLGGTVFPVKNIILYIVQFCRGEDFALIPVYEFTYPEFLEESKEHVAVYTLVYCLILFYSAYSIVTYIAFVPLGPIFMLHACGQLEIVQRRVEKLFAGSPADAELKENLKSIIQQLQEIYSFVDDLNDSFTVVYELMLKKAVVMIPLAFFEVIESFNSGEVSVEFISFICGNILISASPCYHSDLLMEKGDQVRQAIYFSGWERHCGRAASSTRSTLLVLLVRTSRPVAIRSLFRTLCLDTLTDLYQQAYGLFNLMNAMWH